MSLAVAYRVKILTMTSKLVFCLATVAIAISLSGCGFHWMERMAHGQRYHRDPHIRGDGDWYDPRTQKKPVKRHRNYRTPVLHDSDHH